MNVDGRENEERSLAVVVAKPRAERAIEALTREGVYDDSRKIRGHDDERVELPVVAKPTETQVERVIRQPDPEPRSRTLETLLRDRGWTEEEVDSAPGSWAVIGSVVLVTLGDCPREEEVGEALLALHGNADTVLANEGVSGEHREPSVRVVAGAGDTETVHTEHGTRYALDLSRVMFSPGNQAERARMGCVVEEGEAVFDMFAGIGYFTLPMARTGARVTAVERNPVAFRYLLENAMLNEVSDRIDAYRADCRAVEADADRVVMGYYDAHEYLDSALTAIRSGGVLHLHEATPNGLLWDRPFERLQEATERNGREVSVLDRRVVKGHSEGVSHVVVDARVE
ncbi:class I SAM-dependent methyltransferase [Natronorarus salvus]|uniref:class I SAM-dependent methyltransferase n=1 Tax=Natronorarus salvus TaxID=3117733 RepID=UPI002F2657A1